MSGQEIYAARLRAHSTKNDGENAPILHGTLVQASPLIPQSPTFYHFNGKSTSCIDLFTQRKCKEIMTSNSIHSWQPFKTSPHDLVSPTIHVIIHSNKAYCKAAKKEPKPRVRWDK